jgi:hypothetical protein
MLTKKGVSRKDTPYKISLLYKASVEKNLVLFDRGPEAV